MTNSGRSKFSDGVPLKWMKFEELDQVAQIDRTELLDELYTQSGTHIAPKRVDAFTAHWPNVRRTVEFCHGHMRNGAEALGAFDGAVLVGIGMMTPHVQPQVAQLSFLHVSNGYRRRGIATRLMNELMPRAKEAGHKSVYVTASPTRSAVSFYRHFGFTPTDQMIPHLFELEPEDIHMIATF